MLGRIAFLCLTIALPLLPAKAAELEFIFYRAPQPLDWSTPGKLTRTMYKNMGHKVVINGASYDYPHAISHVNVKVQCDGEEPIYRGMTSTKSDFSYVWDLLIEGVSMDTMITNVKGRFYENKEILAWLEHLKMRGYARSLRMNINQMQCGQLKRYLADYKGLRLDKIYGGLRSDPLIGQGAGCAAFAVSFLRVLGYVPKEFQEQWKRQLDIPDRLLTTKSKTAEIGFFSFINGKDTTWAQPGEPQIHLDFWDPELMYNWVGNVATDQVRFRDPLSVEAEYGGKFLAVRWDLSRYPTNILPAFKINGPDIAENTRHHQNRADDRLTEDEVKNWLAHECRRFKLCRKP
jgi:hypothetical protein